MSTATTASTAPPLPWPSPVFTTAQLSPDHAESVLYTFGTGSNYTGLWRDARQARPVDPTAIQSHAVTFAAAAPVAPMADAMVSVDHHWDHLKLLQKNNWQKVSNHPDLDSAHQALQLMEHFTEIARTDAVKTKPQDFQHMLSDSKAASASLREALAANPIDRDVAEASFKRIGQSCAGLPQDVSRLN